MLCKLDFVLFLSLCTPDVLLLCFYCGFLDVCLREICVYQFGYVAVIFGGSQMLSVMFSSQLSRRLGSEWSFFSGVIMQMNIMITFCFLVSPVININIPLPVTLALICCYFISYEFTYSNSTAVMTSLTPVNCSQVIQLIYIYCTVYCILPMNTVSVVCTYNS